jgi:hypothetical protein
MSSDPINPKHYKRDGIECINAIKAALVDGFPDYLRGNVLKYLWRYKERNGAEDLRKARQYLEWLIEESEAIAEASGASDEPSNDTQIPQGWRELKHDEVPSVGDKFLVDGGWVTLLSNWTVTYGAAPSRQVYIRKIEIPPKRYREPTQADLRDGPIECEYRDNDDEQWRSGLVVYILNGSMRFLCADKEEQLSGQWEQCRIEVAE